MAALVVPQGMSYASLAGLPSVYGLYGAFVPVLCYAALGSSRHLVSPSSIVFTLSDDLSHHSVIPRKTHLLYCWEQEHVIATGPL